MPTSSSGGCSVSHLRCPESAGNFSHQRTRRDPAAVHPDFSRRFGTPQIRKRAVHRHHHRAFARSAICGALNLREISATSARAEIVPPSIRISPTDSGLRRLGNELCADIIIGRFARSVICGALGGIAFESEHARRHRAQQSDRIFTAISIRPSCPPAVVSI